MQEVLIIGKSFIDLFASGRSIAKILLFIFFSLGTLVLFFLKRKIPTKPKFTYLTIFFLACTFIFGLFVHIHSISKFNLETGVRVLYMSEYELTSSEITHTHELKSSFGIFSQGFKEDIDIGSATVGFLDAYVPFIGILLLLLIILSYILFVLQHEYVTKKELILKSLLFFILIKNAFDGGVFNYETIAVFLFCLSIYLYYKNKFVFILPILCTLFITSTSFFYPFHILQTYIFLCSIYIILYTQNNIYKIAGLLCISALMLFNSKANLDYLHISPKESEKVFFALFKPLQDFESLYSIGNLFVYKTQNTQIKDIISQYNLTDNHRPVSVEWQTCLPNTDTTYIFMIWSEKILTNEIIQKNNWYQLRIENVGKNTYQAQLTLYNCMSLQEENQIQEGLREMNMLPAIIYDLYRK